MNNIIKISTFYRSFRKKNPMLYMFLKEHKALKKFSKNCNYRIDRTISIGGAFLWNNTDEGAEFWLALDSDYGLFRRKLLKEL